MFSADIDTNSPFVLALLNSSVRDISVNSLRRAPQLRIPDGLWSVFFAQRQVLWGPCCVSCCFLTLDGAHSKRVAVHCGSAGGVLPLGFSQSCPAFLWGVFLLQAGCWEVSALWSMRVPGGM